METKRIYLELSSKNILSDDKLREALKEGAELLKKGEVIAFPTETVYGLGANALDSAACERIFQIKGRPADNPLIVHVASIEQAKKIAAVWTDQASICAQKFWPGPLTIVLPKEESIPAIVSGGLETVAIRMPSHPVALALIEMAGCPLAAPSANISGKPSPTEGKHVWQDLQGKIPLLIDSGKCAVGLESTVLDLSGDIPVILRPGGITREQLSKVLGKVDLDSGARAEVEPTVKPKAPGMKYRHYAPQGEIILVSGDIDHKVKDLTSRLRNIGEDNRIALICMEETARTLDKDTLKKVALLFILGSYKQPDQAASRLFEGLRLCDEEHINMILAEEMPEVGIGVAFMNRLKKAAGKNNYSDLTQL